MEGGREGLSASIDNRIVEMQFDNSQFEKGVGKSIKSLEKLKKGLKMDEAAQSLSKLQKIGDSFSLAKIADGIDNLTYRFSWMGRTVSGILDNLTFKAKALIKSMSVDQISSGWSKYSDKTGYVQTIMNATGKSIDEVNKYLDKLMWFSDETSYSFVDMTQALGTLTSSGGDINKLIPMLEGMANATAFAGKSAAEFSRTMYNLNQSYSSGYMQYIDWKSVEMAGVGSEQLKQAFIDAGKALGTLTKEGKTKKGTLVSIANFGTTLNEKWADTRVMEKAFGTFSEMTEKAYELIQEGKFDTASDAYAWLATQYNGVGITAAKAAQEAKSFNEAIAATTDAVSSGWMRTFEIIFGNYDEARVMWTDLANWLWDVFASGSEARNELLQSWKDIGGRTTMLEGIYSMFEAFNNLLYAIKDAWREVFPETTADDLMKISNSIKTLGDRIKEAFSYEETETVVDQFTQAITGNNNPLGAFWGELEQGAKGDEVKKLQQKLFDMGYDIGTSGVDGIFGPKTQEALKKFQKDSKIKPTGIFDQKTFDKLGDKVNEVFGKHTPIMIGETTESVTTFSKALEFVKTVAKGFGAGLHIVWTGLKFIGQMGSKVVTVLSPLGKIFTTLVSTISNLLVGVDDAFSNSDKLENFLETIDKWLIPVGNAISDFSDKVVNFITGANEINASSPEKSYENFFDRIKNIFSAFKTWADENINAQALIDKFNLFDIAIASISVMATIIIANIVSIIGNIRNTVKSIKNIAQGIEGLAKGFGNLSIKSWTDKFQEFAKGILMIAAAIGILAVGMVAISKLSLAEIGKGFLGLAGIMGILVLGVLAFSKISKTIDPKTMAESMSILLSLSAAVAILSISLLAISSIEPSRLLFSLISLVAIMAGLVGFIAAVNKLGKVKMDFAVLYVVAEAIASLTKSLVILGYLDDRTLTKGFIALALIMTAFSIFLNSISDIKIKPLALFSLIAVSASINLLILGFISLCGVMKFIDSKTLTKAFISLAGVMAAMILFMSALESIKPDIRAVLGIIPVVAALDAMILGFVALSLAMKIIDAYELSRAFISLYGVMIGLGLFMKALNNIKPDIRAVLGIIPVAAALDAMMIGFVVLSLTMKIIDAAALSRAFISLYGVMIGLGLFMKALNNIKPDIRAVLGIIPVVAALDAMILGFVVLSLTMKRINDVDLIKTFASMGVIMIALKVFMESLSAVKPNIGSIIAIIPMAIAISLLMVAFSMVLRHGKNIDSKTAAIITVAMTTIMLSLAAVCKAAGNMALRNGAAVLISAIGIALLIGSFALAIKSLKDVEFEQIIKFSGSLIAIMSAVMLLTTISGKIGTGVLVKGAFGIGLAFAIIIGIVGGVVGFLGALDKITGGKALEIFENGQKIIETIGRAIGSLFGGFISGIIDPISNSIHALGTGLREISSIQDLPGTLDKAMAAISTITLFVASLDKTGIERNIGAVPRLFIGDNKTNSLLNQIKNFGETVKSISESLGGLGKTNISNDVDKAVNAAVAIKDFIVGLQNVNIDYVKGGIAQWFQGKTKEESILGLIEKFGEAMASTATALSGMPSDADKLTSTATDAADKIIAFIGTLQDRTDVETAKGIFAQWFQGETKEEQILGLIEKFGEAMGTSATALKEMPNNAASLVTTATEAADKIIAFIETLDGRVDIEGTKTIFGKWFKGDSTEETILGLIEKFGTAMKETGTALKEMPASGMENATSNAISAAEKIVGFIESLSTIEVDTHSTKIGDWLGGDSKQKTILDLIKDFGTAMSSVGESLNSLPSKIEGPLDDALSAANKIVLFLTTLNSDEYNIEKKKSVLDTWFTGETKTDSVISRIGDMGVSIKSLADSIPGISATTFSSDVDSMITAYESLAGFINLISSDDYDFEMSGKADTLKTDIKLLGEGITEFAEVTKDVDTTAVSSVANAMSSAMNSVMDVAMPDAAYKASSYLGMFVTVGMNMASGLANGIRKNANLAVLASKKVASQMLEAARETLEVNSPSKKFEKIGMYSDRGLANGVSKNSGLIVSSVEDASTSALDAARSSLSNLANILMGDMDADPVIRPVVDMSDVNRSANRINGLVGGSRAMNIDATVRQAQNVASIMNRNQMQNGTNPNGINGSEPTNPVNVSGNNFYIRSDNDVKMLANELATLTRQQQRSLGAAY